MFARSLRPAVVALALMGLSQLGRAAETAVLSSDAPYRIYLVTGYGGKTTGRGATGTVLTAPPAANWAAADFGDAGWGRYGSDLFAAVGGYGHGQEAGNKTIYLRTAFGVNDPAAAKDVQLHIEYRGGAIVYVNGQEVGRGHLPKGAIDAATNADEYPADISLDAAGGQLADTERPATEHLDRYERRIRKLEVTVPAAALKKGANVLAIELHAAGGSRGTKGGKSDWSPVGLCGLKLTSASGAGVRAYADALTGTTLSNATPLDTIAAVPTKRQSGFLWWGVTVTPAGIVRGNPFEPLAPIRTIAPRGGTCSGQVVVSAPAALSGIKATLSTLKHASGATIPAAAVKVSYAVQNKEDMFCDGLMPAPAEGAKTQPVWVVVDVPREQAPGWYTGELAIAQAGKALGSVPVQIFVAGWTLTDPRNNATLVSMYQSPDTLAEKFNLEPWSDKHFAMIEKSMSSMALMGNDVLLVPVTLDNYLHHKTGLIRWVKRPGGGYEPEYKALERYLDLQTKVWGKPKVVTLSVWQHAYGTRTWFRGMKSETVGPCMVTELDPKTGKMTPMQAPHFGEPGSEEFWKAAIEGARAVVKARGIDDKFLLLGEAFDSRPLEKHRQFFEKIEPGMRWQIYSHFDGGEPRPKDGKFVSLGGFELGLKITPGGTGAVPELSRAWPKVEPKEYIEMQVERTEIHATSSPLSYRVVMRTSGGIARLGLDFWPMVEYRGRIRSYYDSPPNEGWLWRGHVPYLTVPGTDGALRTVRGQMLLEGTQEVEAYVQLIRAKQTATGPLLERINSAMLARQQAGAVGKNLPQAMISLDLPGMAASEYAIAAELAGGKDDGSWSSPPANGAAK